MNAIDVLQMVTGRPLKRKPSAGNTVKSEKLVKRGTGVYAISGKVALVEVDSCNKFIQLPDEVSVAIVHVSSICQIYMTGDFSSREAMRFLMAYGVVDEDGARKMMARYSADMVNGVYTEKEIKDFERHGRGVLDMSGVLKRGIFSQRPDNGTLIADFKGKAWSYLIDALSPKSEPADKGNLFQSAAKGLAQFAGKIGGGSVGDEDDVKPTAAVKPATAKPVEDAEPAKLVEIVTPEPKPAEPVTTSVPVETEPVSAEPVFAPAETDDDMFSIDGIEDVDDA